MIPIFVKIFTLIQCEVLDERLTPNSFPLHPCPSNSLMRFFTGDMDYI